MPTLNRNTIKQAIISILETSGREGVSFDVLENEIKKRLPETQTKEAQTKGKNGSSPLRNTLAWAKIELSKSGITQYPQKKVIQLVNPPEKPSKPKPPKAPKPPRTPKPLKLKKPKRNRPGKKETQEIPPVISQESLIEKLLPVFLKAIADAGLEIVPRRRKHIEWKVTRIKTPKLREGQEPTRITKVVEENTRTRLEALSDEIKKKQATGELPQNQTVNEVLRTRYTQEGHTNLKTVPEWKTQGKLPRRKERALLLWRKTPSNHFLPICLFSQKQVVTISEREASSA